ncbi:MAG: carboxypeptidase regulatory-like domain-containing protein [Nannocystaceae bacterium]
MASQGSSSKFVVVAALAIGGGLLWWLLGRADPEATTEPIADGAGARPDDARRRGLELALRPGAAAELRLARRASITGTIRDDGGEPIAGARVCALVRSWVLPSVDTQNARCSESEADGHYRIDDLFPVRHEVVASAPTFIAGAYKQDEGGRRSGTVSLQPGMEARDIDITLRGGGVELRGVVKDLSGGAVEGAQVSTEHAVGFSGAEGVFSLWVAPGERWVNAHAEGYAGANDGGVVPGHEYQLYLTPEAALVGKVVRAEDGAPVEGVTVTSRSGMGWSWNSQSAITDAAGRFRLGGLEPGAYKAEATGDEVYGLADEQVILGLGETSDPLTVRVHPAFSVRGSVLTKSGESCEDGWLELDDHADARSNNGAIEPDGAVQVRGLLPGEYQVSVRCPGKVPAERYDRVTVVDRSLEGLRWEVGDGHALRGRVVDSRGEPVPAINVRAEAKLAAGQGRAQATSAWSGRTDADGRFELRGLLAGNYDVRASSWSPGRAVPLEPLKVTLPEGRDLDGLKIELPATGELRGRLVDTEGRPIPRASVSLRNGLDWRGCSVTDDGAFSAQDLRPGTYRAVATVDGNSLRSPGTSDDDVQGERIEIVEGEVANLELVVENATGVIRGVVRDEDGGPVADAFVESSREPERAGAASGAAARSNRWGSFSGDPILTDADGRFTIPRIAGKHTLLAHRKGGGEAILEHVAAGDDVVLTIAATGRLSGTVTLAGGGAPEEFSLAAVDEATGLSRRDSFFRSGGAWSLAEIPAGTYKIQVNSGPGSAETEATMVAGRDTEGITIELAPKVTVRGLIVDAEGAPLEGMYVAISGMGRGYAGDDDDKQNVTDSSGRFEVKKASTGSVFISVSSRVSDDYEWTRVPVMIAADAPVAELAPIQVLRRRVERGKVAGDLGYTLKDPDPGADPMERTFVVAFIRPGGPAAKAGLQVGDEIVTVDGVDVRGGRNYLYSGLTRVKVDTTIALGLARGAIVQVTAEERP